MKPTCLTFNALVKKLAKVKSAIILMHRSPDPDTIGSAAALRIILEKNGAAPVDISCADAVADKLSFLMFSTSSFTPFTCSFTPVENASF